MPVTSDARQAADLGEQAQAVAGSSELERSFREMLDLLPAAIYITDAEGRVTYFNSACESFSGRTPELGSDHWCVTWKLYYPDGTPMPHDACPMAVALKEGRTVRGEQAIAERPDGTRIWFEPYPTPLRDADGKIVGGINMLVDITGIKQVEAALRKSERELADFFENAAMGLHWVGPDGTILRANQAELDLTGYSSGEYVGRNITEFHADEDVIADILCKLQAGETLTRYESRLRSKDGTIKHVVIDSNVLWEDDRFVHTRCFTRDITEQKQAEAERAELLCREREARREAEESEQRLLEADRRKDEFLATLSHELRNPLAPIRNSVQIMRLAGVDGEVAEQARETIERQVTHLVRLVDDLLDLSRISSNKFELRRERVALAVIVQSAVETSRPLVEACGQELSVSLPSRAVWVNADLTRMGQAVANLLNNATKYTPQGGRILLSAERQREEAVVRVRDTGIGIPDEMLPHIFEMFRQVDTTQERSQGGLGIGLTLVKNLVEMHGGTVAAHSDGVGRGSEFVLRLPLAKDTAKAASDRSLGDPSTIDSRRILVVDDNLDSAESLALLLEHSGHQTRTAHDGVEAMEAAADFRPDVMLLDIGMPKLNGYEVARRIRAEPWGENIVLVALTGWGQEEDRAKSREAGFDDHFVKPVEHAALTRLLAGLPPASRSGS